MKPTTRGAKNDHKILLTKNFKTKNCNIHKLQKVII
ncbi:hypothetical protein N404_03875 [Helicobacter pylori FD506]|nr:hypothetical protein N404_03875 [Helicobacter pylori FD506]